MQLDICFVLIFICLFFLGWTRGGLQMAARLLIGLAAYILARFLSPKLMSLLGYNLLGTPAGSGLTELSGKQMIPSEGLGGQTDLFQNYIIRSFVKSEPTHQNLGGISSRLSSLFIGILLFALVFFLASLLLSLLVKGISSILDSVPLVGSLNRLAGIFLGLVYAYLLSVIIATVVSGLSIGWPALAEQTAASMLFPFFSPLQLIQTIFAWLHA